MILPFAIFGILVYVFDAPKTSFIVLSIIGIASSFLAFRSFEIGCGSIIATILAGIGLGFLKLTKYPTAIICAPLFQLPLALITGYCLTVLFMNVINREKRSG